MTDTRLRITQQRPEESYRALLGHTLTCSDCRADAECPDRRRLQRDWRRTR
ncbi:hypothetical protein [Streptomyces sp. WL006]|uniref:hypothetical protein n=1 Tax=Streptomyces sp. WL006 TaxID=3423915 RepID=UPI003F6C5492